MFTNKVVLITGASSGIGAQAALDFSKLEANVVINGRNKTNLDKVAKQCQEVSPKKLNPLVIVADISIQGDIENLIKTTVDAFGKIDVLVNNAGVVKPGSIETTTLELYDNTMNTNMRSVFYITALATPHLIKTKGNIINVSSLCGLRMVPNVLAYSVSKAALNHFTRCVAVELAPKGVRVNCVNPGDINTGIHLRSGVFNKQEDYDNFMHNICAKRYPSGRIGESKEVSSVITFLASEAASNVTGVTLPIDGGRQATC